MEQREGDLRPKRQGGDRHSQRIEAHAELILSAVTAKSDMTLAELRERLRIDAVAPGQRPQALLTMLYRSDGPPLSLWRSHEEPGP
jgi:hypothetical protein